MFSSLVRAVASAVTTVDRAGQILKEVMRSGSLGIVEKSLNDIQTEADRNAQVCIVESLSKKFPKMKIIAEEGNLKGIVIKDDWLVDGMSEAVLKETLPPSLCQVREEDIVCWVDPLDGTRDFAKGVVEHVTVLVGFAVEGRAVAGVIHQPFYSYMCEKGSFQRGRTAWGIAGLGVRGLRPGCPPDGFIVTTSGVRSQAAIDACINSMQPTEVIRVAGAGYKMLLVLEGAAHAFVFPSAGLRKWDTCAPEALLAAAGGSVLDLHGKAIQYHAGTDYPVWCGLIASGRKEHTRKYLKLIPESIIKELSINAEKAKNEI